MKLNVGDITIYINPEDNSVEIIGADKVTTFTNIPEDGKFSDWHYQNQWDKKNMKGVAVIVAKEQKKYGKTSVTVQNGDPASYNEFGVDFPCMEIVLGKAKNHKYLYQIDATVHAIPVGKKKKIPLGKVRGIK
jgi:hypothetical protein